MTLTLADFSDDEIARAVPRVGVAFHESGHSVAATVLRGRVFAAVVGGGKYAGTLGHTEYADLPDGHRAAITYAGPWAEARWRAGRRPDMRDMRRALAASASDDKVLSGAGVKAEAAGVVEPLLERCWPSVIALAQKLLRDGEARHEDVCAALQIPTKDNGHHLALIRSGCVPGSFTVTSAM